MSEINPENPLLRQMDDKDLWRRFLVVMVALHGKEAGKSPAGFPIREIRIGAHELDTMNQAYGDRPTMTLEVKFPHTPHEYYLFRVMDEPSAHAQAVDTGNIKDLDVASTIDLMFLVDDSWAHGKDDLVKETVAGWSQDQRQEVARWAAREHFIASDNEGERLPKPAIVTALEKRCVGGG